MAGGVEEGGRGVIKKNHLQNFKKSTQNPKKKYFMTRIFFKVGVAKGRGQVGNLKKSPQNQEKSGEMGVGVRDCERVSQIYKQDKFQSYRISRCVVDFITVKIFLIQLFLIFLNISRSPTPPPPPLPPPRPDLTFPYMGSKGGLLCGKLRDLIMIFENHYRQTHTVFTHMQLYMYRF